MQANPHPELKPESTAPSSEGADSAGNHTLEKNCYHPTVDAPVPQTDTGGRVEYTKALRRLAVKELGKMTP